MNDHWLYLLLDAGTISIPFVFSFYRKTYFVAKWNAFWPANLITALLFIGWDILYTHAGIWGFNARYLTGVSVGNLPVEEVLFFICIPYASVFTYFCFRTFFSKVNIPAASVTVVLVVALLAGGVIFFQQAYTVVTFFALALLLLYLQFVKRASWMPHFYLLYLVILIPFFIVNGILTGTGIDEPVVWYSEDEIIGFRMLTIPFEDVFYGMLMLLMNIALFERFRKSIGE